MSINILLDMDGVLVDFIGGACDIHNKNNPYTNKHNYGKHRIDKLLGLELDDFWKPLDHGFWAELKWMEDGVKIISLIEHKFGDENITLLTSPSECPGAASGKMEWVQQRLPDYSRRVMIGAQKHLCANANSILIDDCAENCHKFRIAGGHAILVPRPWNCLHRMQGPFHTLEKELDVFRLRANILRTE